MKLLESITSKVAAGIAGLAVATGGISWFFATPETRLAVTTGVGRGVGWILLVVLLPWATFFLIGLAAKKETNAAGAILVGAYTFSEFLVLSYLFGLQGHGAVAWVFIAVGLLVAAAYNILTCDWIAEKLTGR